MNNIVKEIRAKMNFSVEEISAALEITPAYYYKIEQGVRNPSFGFLKKLKAAFPDVDINPIFETNHKN